MNKYKKYDAIGTFEIFICLLHKLIVWESYILIYLYVEEKLMLTVSASCTWVVKKIHHITEVPSAAACKAFPLAVEIIFSLF